MSSWDHTTSFRVAAYNAAMKNPHLSGFFKIVNGVLIQIEQYYNYAII